MGGVHCLPVLPSLPGFVLTDPTNDPADAASNAPVTSPLREPAYLVSLVVAVVVALGFGLVVPVLPLFARSFGVGLFAVTVVVSVFAGVRLVSNLYTGALTDRIGSRSAIGWGAIIVAASSLLTATAASYWQLVAYRGVGGFGSALFFNALLTHVVGIVPAHQRGRAVGGLQAAFLLGISLGPTVGGLLAEPLGLRWPFVIYAITCGLAGVVALRFLPDEVVVDEAGGKEARPRGVKALLRVARDLCTDPTFAIALVLMAASRWAATGVRFSLVPLLAVEQAGATTLVMSLALTLAALTHLAITWPAGKVADTIGRRTLSVPAFAIYAVVTLLLGWSGAVVPFLILMGMYGIATGLTAVTPPAVVGDLVPPQRTGVAIGVLNTAGDFGSVLGPLVSGVLAEAYGFPAGFGASAALLAIGAVLALRMRETLPERAG